MADLIDRQSAIKYLATRPQEFIDELGKGWSEGVKSAIGALEKFPAVDAVVPPCKVGDTLFDIYEAKANGTGEIKALPVAEMHIHVDKRNKAWFIIGGYYFDEADFGKTVFLTREEAKAALNGERREDDG